MLRAGNPVSALRQPLNGDGRPFAGVAYGMDEPLVEKAAREIIEQYGRDAVPILRERAEIADGLGDILAAETWRDIADAAERILAEDGR